MRGARPAAGEMLVGPKRVLFMDEISTGLDSSTTYQARSWLRPPAAQTPEQAAARRRSTRLCGRPPHKHSAELSCIAPGSAVLWRPVVPQSRAVPRAAHDGMLVRSERLCSKALAHLESAPAHASKAESAKLRLQIVKYLRDATHELRYTTMVALLQPAPETYELFDDVLLLSDGAQRAARCPAACLAAGHGLIKPLASHFGIVYVRCFASQACSTCALPRLISAWLARGAGYLVFHGPRAMVPDFFEALGFRCPERKGEADFLQEVGSPAASRLSVTASADCCVNRG